KQKLFERIDAELAPMREQYEALIAKPARIEELLHVGARKARERSTPLLKKLRNAVGIRALTYVAAVDPQDQLRKEVQKEVWGEDVVMPLDIKGPWQEGSKIGLTIQYSQKKYFLAEKFSSKRDAGLAKKQLEDGQGVVEIVPDDEGFLFNLQLILDDRLIGHGPGLSSAAQAEDEREKFHKARQMFQAEKLAREAQKS
ncbi:MAG: hypothetical protein ABIS07_18220, partial [Dokdonella sp.]